MSSIYTEKWVLFLDILGFGDIINNKSEEYAEIILKLMELALNDIKKEVSNAFNVSQFSDTFIISGTSIEMVLGMTSFLQQYLLGACLLSRGAITYGKVFHNGSQFIGPAITRAYNLEKSEAIYPRVIIDPLCEYRIASNSLLMHISDGMTMQDFDGYWYVWIMGVSKTEGVEQNALLIGNINELYEKYKNTKHRGKYTWLKQKADEFVQNTK